MSTDLELANEWNRIMAPHTGDIRSELVEEAAAFLDIPIADAVEKLATGGKRFQADWNKTMGEHDAKDPEALTRFYNHSDAELFELMEWHVVDPIHYRSLILRDFALKRPGRQYLDYGSGIGSDAMVFAGAGFQVTLADISDLLLAFAAFRCRRRGYTVKTIDLKKESLPKNAYDVAVCFDVLEHILDPVPVVQSLRESLHDGGWVAIHAPFGVDPERPMHVVHRDLISPKIRAMGLLPQDLYFPPLVLAPNVYEKTALTPFERAAYRVYDGYLQNRLGTQLAFLYRRMLKRPSAQAQKAS